MSRYLFDTIMINIMLMARWDEVSKEVKDIVFSSYENQLYMSSISGIELSHLHVAGKIDNRRKRKFAQPKDMFVFLKNELNVEIKPFGEEHMLTVAKLNHRPNHSDPFDHAIIAHAMTERLTLISSDKKFGFYTRQGLDFIFNERY